MTRAEFIAALEAAEGPSRELDQDIALAVGWYFAKETQHFPTVWFDPSDTERDTFPHYTSSIDTALSFTPEGWRWGMQNLEDQTGKTDVDFYYAHLEHKKELYAYGRQSGKSTNPAIALCIANLRALEAQETNQ